MAGDPDYQPMKTELDALQAATAAVTSAVDLARALTQTTPYEESTSLATVKTGGNPVAAGVTENFMDIAGKGKVLLLDLSAMTDRMAAKITIDGTLIYYSGLGAALTSETEAAHLNAYTATKNTWWELIDHNGAGANSIMAMRIPFYFNTSLKIDIVNRDAATKNYAMSCLYRIRT